MNRKISIINYARRIAGNIEAMVLMVSISFVLDGCDLLKINPNAAMNLTASFILIDTSGNVKPIIHTGESFGLSFMLINTTSDTITYRRGNTGPAVIFEILKNDSIVATSVDGYAFAQVVLGGVLPPRDTLSGYWKAPTTPAQYPKVILYAGAYEARFLLPPFDNAKVSVTEQIRFSVSP